LYNNTYSAKILQEGTINLNQFSNERNCRQQNTMIPVGQKILGFVNKMIRDIWNFLNDTQSAQGSLKCD